MAKYAWWADTLTGGGAGALDAIDGAELNDGDLAIVHTDTYFYIYFYDTSSSESEVSPQFIVPDANADGVWVLKRQLGAYEDVGKSPNGFPNRTDSTLAFDNGTRVFTLGDAGSGYSIMHGARLFSYTGDKSASIDDVNRLNWLTIDEAGTLTASTDYDFSSGDALVATLSWDGSTGMLGEERHGFVMDNKTHEVMHDGFGPLYESGFALTFLDDTFTIGAGQFHDEDLEHEHAQQTTCRVLYRLTAGSPSTWTWSATGQTKYYNEDGSSNIYYDNAGTPTPAGANQYTCQWIYISNDVDVPVYSVMGQRVDTTLANARINNVPENLDISGLPSAEMILVARVILRNDATPYVETEDYRGSFITGRTSVVYGAANTASNISTDITNFNGILSATDTDTQTALETIDDHIHQAQTLTNDGITPNSGTLTISATDIYAVSSTSKKTEIKIENTNADSNGPRVAFHKNSSSPADNDELGIMPFYGDNSIGASTQFGYMRMLSSDVTSGWEAAQFEVVLNQKATKRNYMKLKATAAADTGSIIFNEDAQDVNFRIESVVNADSFFLQGDTGNVGIGTSSPGSNLHIHGTGDFYNSIVKIENNEADNTPSMLEFSKVSASPADDDCIQSIISSGKNSADEDFVYTYHYTYAADVTDGDEAAHVQFFVAMDGTVKNLFEMDGSAYGVGQGLVRVNAAQEDVDFRVNSNGIDTSFLIRGDNGHCGILETTPAGPLHVSGQTAAWSPTIICETNINDSSGAVLNYRHLSTSPADNDVIGTAYTTGRNSAAQNFVYTYHHQGSQDVTDGDEAGFQQLIVAVNGVTRALFSVNGYYTGVGQASVQVNQVSIDTDFIVNSNGIANTFKVTGSDGIVSFGVHTAVGSESLSGYITIRDRAGTTRKLAVVS